MDSQDTKPHIYPLIDVLEVKKRRSDRAQRIVTEKTKQLQSEKNALQTEKENLAKAEKTKLKRVKDIEEEIYKGTTINKMEQYRYFIETLDIPIKKQAEVVKEQEKKVQTAETALQEAQHAYKLAQLEIDKIQEHQKEWQKTEDERLIEAETAESDDLSVVLYAAKVARDIQLYGNSSESADNKN